MKQPKTAVERFGFAEGGALVLDTAAHTIRFNPPVELRERVERTADRADQTTFKWGTTLLMVLAAIGALLWARGQRKLGYAVFGLAGAVGVGGGAVRRVARGFGSALFGPLPLSAVVFKHNPAAGTFRIVLNAGGPRKMVVTLGPGEFDPVHADAFLRAFDAAKG